jgi:hypothetical protein
LPIHPFDLTDDRPLGKLHHRWQQDTFHGSSRPLAARERVLRADGAIEPSAPPPIRSRGQWLKGTEGWAKAGAYFEDVALAFQVAHYRA